MKTTIEHIQRSPETFSFRPLWLLWGVLIILQGVIFCKEPLGSAVFIFGCFLLIFYVASAIINTRLTLGFILSLAIFLPLKFLSFPILGFTFDPCALLVLVLIFILWSKGAVKGKFQIVSTPLDRWFILLGVLAILSSIFSTSILTTVDNWQHIILLGPAIYFMVYNYFETSTHIRRGFWFIFILFIIVGAETIIESVIKSMPLYHDFFIQNNGTYNPTGPIYRVVSFTGNAVVLGIGFSTILPFTIFGFQRASTLYRRMAWGLLSLILMVGALVTYSRGTLITIAIIILLSALRSLKSLVIGFLVLVVMVIVVMQTQHFIAVVMRLNPKFLMQDASIWHRLLMYWTSWHVLLDHPWFGAGLGTMSGLYQQYKHPADFLNVPIVDNQFLTFMYGTGILGMIIILGLLSKILTQLLKSRNHEQVPIIKSFYYTGFISVLGFYINSMTFESFLWGFSSILFWFVVALLMRLTTLPGDQIKPFFKLFGYYIDSPVLSQKQKAPE